MSEPKACDFVYCGRRIGKGGSLVDQIALIQKDGSLAPALYFNALRSARVLGGVYTGALFSEGKAVGLNTAGYTGHQWGRDHPDDVLRWEALDSQARQAHRRKSLEKDATKCRLIDETLDPLRVLYAAMHKRGDYDGMQALESAILESLRRAK